MSYSPDKRSRRNLRLAGYDYAQAGAYFATICAQGRECLFGDVIDNEMALSDAGKMVSQWFKTMTTNEYMRRVRQGHWPPFPGKLWQRNYYERVIRNDVELNAVRQYIASNPAKWNQDTENPRPRPSESSDTPNGSLPEHRGRHIGLPLRAELTFRISANRPTYAPVCP